MKKQKKPIILVVLLAALFAGVAFMNRPPKNPNDDRPAPDSSATQEKKGDVADNVSKEIADVAPTPPKNGKPMGGPGKPGVLDTPSILKIKAGPQEKQKPNDSMTSTQWYTKESARGQDKP